VPTQLFSQGDEGRSVLRCFSEEIVQGMKKPIRFLSHASDPRGLGDVLRRRWHNPRECALYASIRPALKASLRRSLFSISVSHGHHKLLLA
jgi:hypothetical protein